MPKPPLIRPLAELERQIILTMRAGLHRWRPDLTYPDSYSDMQACVREVLSRYELTPRPHPLSRSEMTRWCSCDVYEETGTCGHVRARSE